MGYSLNHLVAMVTNNKTDLSHSVYQNYHRNIMECDTDESHFLNLESEDLDRLESLADSYFCTREMKRKLLTPTPTAIQAIIFDDNKRNFV